MSASVYSKVPKTKSCLFVDIWVQTFAVKYYLGGKNFVINCVYILVFFTVGSYWPHGTVNVTFFHGTRAGSNQNDIKRFIYIIFLRNRPVYANSWSCTQKKNRLEGTQGVTRISDNVFTRRSPRVITWQSPQSLIIRESTAARSRKDASRFYCCVVLKSLSVSSVPVARCNRYMSGCDCGTLREFPCWFR